MKQKAKQKQCLLQEKFFRYLDQPAPGLPVSDNLRQKAAEAFRKSGFPHNKIERWRNTDLKGLCQTDFEIFNRDIPYEKELSEIFLCEVHGFESRILSVLNGSYYDREKLTVDPQGVIVGSLAAALKKYPALVERHLNTILPQSDGFKALNMALAGDGVFIYVPDNVQVENTLQIINILNRPNLAVNVRNLFVLGKNARLRLLNCDDSVNHHAGFINKVNEIFLDDNAELEL
ncbi:MAG TPA: hypothetical protein ENJ69_03345, partial [Bacteroidetes bacterium]|nr:hypothetical protein [Bacteroidota bacterium]